MNQSAGSTAATSSGTRHDGMMPTSAMTGRAWLGVLATVAMLAVAWSNTFAEMWLRWFPGWDTYAHLKLMDRLTKGDSYYTHGPLVPLTSLVIAFFIYKRVGLPVQRRRSSTIAGATLLVAFLVLHLLSVYARVMFVSGFSLIGVLGGLILLWGGWSLALAYWLPVALLVFMVPLPMSMIADLNLQLKSLASDVAMWLTSRVFLIPVVKDGSFLYLPLDAAGNPKVLVVEDVCSGLRSLISLTFFASLFALVCRVRGVWRLFMLLMAVPVAVACNVVRITALNLVAHYWSVADAGEDAWFHNFSGLAVFALALAMLFGLERIIITASALLRRNWVDLRLLGYLDSLPRIIPMTLASARPLVLAALLATAVLSVRWSRADMAQINRGDTARTSVSTTITLGEDAYVGIDSTLDDKTLTILETRDYLLRRFNGPRGPLDVVDLLIVFSPDNRKGTHPPEVCLTGGGEEVLRKEIVPTPIPGHEEMTMVQLVTQRDQRMAYHLYVYKCGDSYTPGFFTQQLRVFLNGIASRNAAGALIHITVPIQQANEEPARRLAMDAVRVLLPQIDRGLDVRRAGSQP